MDVLACLLLFSGAYPLWLAWRGNRATSLRHAVVWAAAAWAGWGGVAVLTLTAGAAHGQQTARYLALSLTACAVVAVLGARRPGVGAWNLVLLGLLAVMLLPLAESLVAGDQPPGVVRIVFLGGTLAVGVVNYLPTRLGGGALLLAAGCAAEILTLADGPNAAKWLGAADVRGYLVLALVPWAAYLGWQLTRPPESALDRLWLDFRDRFGLLWGQRVREQFYRAAVNAGWPVQLAWGGFAFTAGAADERVRGEVLATLRALLKRFMPPSGQPEESP